MSSPLGSRSERRNEPFRSQPQLAAALRRIAIVQETAFLLEARASRTASADRAALLRRRAAAHRLEAQRLRAELGQARRCGAAAPLTLPRR